MSLPKVIEIIENKCQNCHACIAACPSKFCNDGSSDHVTIHPDLCIGCGECVRACTWGARVAIDDTEAFFKDLEAGYPMVAFVAPAVAVAFPDKYLNLNGWLRSIGVADVFDVSFGAEITVHSYLDYIQKNNPKTIIAQPCPAIVTYIEIYHPELLKYLIPLDSPMLHTIKMVKEYFPQYAHHKVAVISPCATKKREFEATGYGDYNVTMSKLDDYLTANNINLSQYPALNYDNPPAERAVGLSTPGGLMETVLRGHHELRPKIRKIEGPHAIYPYLEHLVEDINRGCAPFMIDCLNCEAGCNGGTGTKGSKMTMDYLECELNKRKEKVKQLYLKDKPYSDDPEKYDQFIEDEVENFVKKYWRPGLYDRHYTNRSKDNIVSQTTQSDLKNVYQNMHKEKPEDFKNCCSCGYGNCKDMATAIYHGLNKPQNCYYYEKHVTNQAIQSRKKAIDDFQDFIQSQFNSRDSLSRFAPILKSIEDVAMQTSILSINASIEAARAGNAGAGFGIVAKSIGELAEKTRDETNKMHESLNELKKLIDDAIVDFENELKK